MSDPRTLVIMGSGEFAPTMAKVHVSLFDRLGQAATGTVIDTPYGFQENADELTERAVAFFRDRVGRSFSVASYRGEEVDPAAAAAAVARIRDASYVMAGPGSPSYALRAWRDGPIPAALASRLDEGGILTMASAAALTLGVVTIPVYEIYKVGEPPHWLDGLDLLGHATGLRAAVVPHFDNAEGGTHDTRYCYLGERRLRILERALPDGAFVLGVDSHTAAIFDLAEGRVAVRGLGGLTVRVDGRSSVLGAGPAVPIEALATAANRLRAGDVDVAVGEAGPRARAARSGRTVAAPRDGHGRPGSIRGAVADLEGAFVDGLGDGDPARAVEALLALDDAIDARTRTGEDSLDLDNARSIFRSLIVRLGEAAIRGTRDPRDAVDPFVSALLEVRARARTSGDWATADLIRDRLATAGVEVRDVPDGSDWRLMHPGEP
jgi:cyanophycinase-like exopeptidase